MRAVALKQLKQAHVAIGGTKPGRRYAVDQINHAYAVLLASQFQGFCRDLHSECVEYFVSSKVPDVLAQRLVHADFTWSRQLDRGNAQPASIGSDFGRLGISLWTEAEVFDPRSASWKSQLELLNSWRNAIAHQDFDPNKLGGVTVLRLAAVRRFQTTCHRLARTFDHVMAQYLKDVTGVLPW